MNTLSPKISVITVCYNPGNKIIDTINSVLNQTYPFREYIIIDGASTDATPEIINSFKDKVDVIISEPDRGIYDAMNKGIRNATGDLIIFLNAGDYYVSSTVLEYAINKMNLQEGSVFFGRFIWESPETKDLILSDHSSIHYDWDLKMSNFPHPATFYKRNSFTKVGVFDENFKILGDYEWNVRALVKYRLPFKYLDIITAKFTADGISNNSNYTSRLIEETNEIFNQYFQPVWLFNLVSKFLMKKNYFNYLVKKIIAKSFGKKLHRRY